jgi:hypothetical protein
VRGRDLWRVLTGNNNCQGVFDRSNSDKIRRRPGDVKENNLFRFGKIKTPILCISSSVVLLTVKNIFFVALVY